MQAVITLFTALFLMVSSFFTALPHTFLLDRQTPEQTITDVEEVLALYQEYAAKNEGIRLRATLTPVSPSFSTNLLASAVFIGVYDGAVPSIGFVWKGMPGEPENITADDLSSAEAAYYRGGKTLVITLVPKLDENADAALDRVVGFMLDDVDIEYQQAKVEICVNAANGKIVAANYSATVKANYGLALVAKCEMKLP